ncbi:MAG: beta-lactamase family protein [Rhodothermaceae bacterium]|nr:beta-lactamase family protein [Rhodothermaceae bacterium]
MNLIASLLFMAFSFSGPLDADSINHQLQVRFDRHNTPGALVVWVKDGQVVINSGFGYANLDEQRPVDPAGTLVRVGSISKPFTGIGILNSVETGELDLRTDVNTWFNQPVVDDRFALPVTLEHLLTHTAGFDDRYIGKSARTVEEAMSLQETIRKLLPSRFIEPGEIASYSNFGVALAGYVLEHVSGTPFSMVMKDRVFHPLGMNNTSFDPRKDALADLMTGYFLDGDLLKPLDYDYILDAPAGQMVTTGEDMARFMLQMLDSEGLQEAGVLSAGMTAEMMQIQFTHHPELSGGYGYLWSITDYGGHAVIGHAGGYIGVAARLLFFPQHNAALFVAANTMDFGFIGDVIDFFTQHYLPEPAEVVRPTKKPAFDDGHGLSAFTGTWRETRYSRNYFTKFGVLIGMMGSEMTTGSIGDSLLTMPDHTGEIRRLRRVGPVLFQSLDDDYMLAFREDLGEITHVFTSGTTAMERLHPLETRMFHIILLSALFTVFLIITLFYPGIWLYRRIRGVRTAVRSKNLFEWGIAALYAFGFILYIPVMAQVPAHEYAIGFGYGIPAGLYVLTLFPWAALLLTILYPVHLFRRRLPFDRGMVRAGLIITASVVFFMALNYWNLAGWRF